MPSIVISHSSRDAELARKLIDLLEKALRLDPQSIRCSSIQGYRLPGGERTDERLRQEIADCRVLIALVTRSSLRSHNAKALDGLRGAGLLRQTNDRYFLTDEGDRVTREYLLAALEKGE